MYKQYPRYSQVFSFSPVNVFKIYKGKKYRFMGEYRRDPYLIVALRRELEKARYSIKIEQKPDYFIIWGRER